MNTTLKKEYLKEYPNVNEEKIPDGEELTRFVKLIRDHEMLFLKLDTLLNDVRQPSVPPLQFAERQDADIAVYSYSSSEFKKSIDRLEGQLPHLQATLKMLRGPVHPIRRCPTDILREVFEWLITPQSPRKWCYEATRLSNVCYRWRQVLTEIPKFWSRMHVPLKSRCPGDIEAFWTRSVERVRMYPASILIQDISEKDWMWQGFQTCRFDLIPNIQILQLWISTNEGARRMVADSFPTPNPSTNIQTLEIGSTWQKPTGHEILSIDPSPILLRFPSFRTVKLEDFNFRSFSLIYTFKTVIKVQISKSTGVPLSALSEVFPNATKVVLCDCRCYEEEGTGVVVWPQVRQLMVTATEKVSWDKLKMQQIQLLNVPRPDSIENFVKFFASHPSLDKFYARYMTEGYGEIARKAPQLSTLSMPASKARHALDFPNLSNLQLFQDNSDDLSLELVETIVRRFFLSPRQTHTAISTTPIDAPYGHSYRLLRISVPMSRCRRMSLHWVSSALLSQATHEIETTQMSEETRKDYRYHWD